MTPRLVVILIAFMGGGAGLASTNVAEVFATQPGSIETAIQWGRLIGGIIGVIGAVFGAVMLYVAYRISSRTKTVESQETTINIYKEELEAWKKRDEARTVAIKEMLETQTLREKEIAMLRARTDLTEVVKSIQEMMTVQGQLLKMKQEHDQQIVENMTAAVKAGDTKYQSLMEAITKAIQAGDAREERSLGIITKMIEQTGKSQTDTLAQSKENYAAMQALLKSVDALAKRFGHVENKVDEVKRTVEDANGTANTPEPTEKQERRSRTR